MNEDEHGQQLAEFEQQQESERQEWAELWARARTALDELKQAQREVRNGTE